MLLLSLQSILLYDKGNQSIPLLIGQNLLHYVKRKFYGKIKLYIQLKQALSKSSNEGGRVHDYL